MTTQNFNFLIMFLKAMNTNCKLEDLLIRFPTNGFLIESQKTPINGMTSQSGVKNPSEIVTKRRYCCPKCPYSTDRRDLYTRHENIHRDEKPFRSSSIE